MSKPLLQLLTDGLINVIYLMQLEVALEVSEVYTSKNVFCKLAYYVKLCYCYNISFRPRLLYE